MATALKDYDLIVFDLDDTLVETQDLNIMTYIKTTQSVVNKQLTVKEKKYFFKHISKGINYILKEIGYENFSSQIKEYKKNIWNSFTRDKIQLVDNTILLLDTIKKNKIPMGIITNASRMNTDFYLSKHKLKKYFKTVVTRDDINILKPDIRIALKFMANLGKYYYNVLYVGDSKTDKEFAEKLKWDYKDIKDLHAEKIYW